MEGWGEAGSREVGGLYGSKYDTWEPQENIHPSDIQEFLEVQAGECEATDDESDAEEPAQQVPAKTSAKPAVAKRKVPAPRANVSQASTPPRQQRRGRGFGQRARAASEEARDWRSCSC